jgi:hypothetical protein
MATTIAGDTESPKFNNTSNPYSGNTYESLGGASRLTPNFQSIFVNTRPQISTADQLLQAARERLRNAGGAARMKMREQEEQGVRSYVPANPEAVSAELRGRMGVTQGGQAIAIQQRPTGGVIADYGGGNRVITSRYGTGTATASTGVDNKYARADKERVLAAIKKGGEKEKKKKAA